jgi:hypothetical protein
VTSSGVGQGKQAPQVTCRRCFLVGAPAPERTQLNAAAPICSLERSPPTRYTPAVRSISSPISACVSVVDF